MEEQFQWIAWQKLFTKNNEGNNDVYLNTLKILLKNEIHRNQITDICLKIWVSSSNGTHIKRNQGNQRNIIFYLLHVLNDDLKKFLFEKFKKELLK